MASVNASQSVPPAMSPMDDDLGKWIDLDGLCEDSLSDGVGRDIEPPSSSIPSKSVSATQIQPEKPTQQTKGPDRATKLRFKPKGHALPRNTSLPEYSVICFPSSPSHPAGIKKKRKDFDDKRRLEVAQCGIGDPCKACERAAGSLGSQLCIREKLTKMRFTSGDLHYIDYTARLLDQELIAGTTHIGPPRQVAISMDYPDNPALHVEVQDYFGNETPPWLCCWVVMNQVGGQIEFHREESARYALPQLLPAKALVNWVENIVTYQDTRNIGFQQAVDAFIMRYSKSSASLPMHNLVRNVHEFNCLTKIRLGLVLCVDEHGNTTPPSCALQTQFGQISKAASQRIEKYVLGELEKIVFGASGIGPSNGIALWASLWCLILMYRKLVRSYIAFQQFPCHVPKDYSGFPECKLEAGTHFYHYLVSIYAALFRATSPLYADFRVTATRQLLNDDELLVRAFMNLRTESFYFRKYQQGQTFWTPAHPLSERESPWMTAPEDQLLRRMILDREADLQAKPPFDN
ncbi:hypothetical protein QQZ08_010388 [Neonectria magnoliae]|uniref:Uncharacterized protein n=1 Tax=Neonectria magnoliae TaxID=2732573 RepID=A0ABR1HHL8_9HYPO